MQRRPVSLTASHTLRTEASTDKVSMETQPEDHAADLRECSRVGCTRQYPVLHAPFCCSSCARGMQGRTRRCNKYQKHALRDATLKLRVEFSTCITPGCGRTSGYGHTTCCSVCTKGRPHMHTRRCQRGSMVAATSRAMGQRSGSTWANWATSASTHTPSSQGSQGTSVMSSAERDNRSDSTIMAGMSETSVNKVATSLCLDDLD